MLVNATTCAAKAEPLYATLALPKVPVAVTVRASPATMPLNTALFTFMVAVLLPSYTLSLAAMPVTVMALAVMVPLLAVSVLPLLKP